LLVNVALSCLLAVTRDKIAAIAAATVAIAVIFSGRITIIAIVFARADADSRCGLNIMQTLTDRRLQL
jgi:hypothetical protein